MRTSRFMMGLSLLLLAAMMSTPVQAAVSVTVTPSSQIVPQLSTATYSVGLSGATYNEAYSISVLGLPSGSVYSSPSITTAAGSGSGSVVLTTGNLPGLYCPGTYTFQVQASSTSAPTDTGTSAISSITVTQVGPPLHVTAVTDKPTYRVGDKVTLTYTVNRPAEGYLTIYPPSGSPTVVYIPTYYYGIVYTYTKTFTADKIGRWSVTLQADDFCAGSDSTQIFFDVTPDTYDVSLSLTGVPADASVNINIDGTPQGTMLGSEIKKLSFKVDTQHTISVDQYVSGQTGYRYYCQQNIWNVGSAGSRTFDYEAQVQLTVSTDPVGVTQVSGDGWYKIGSVVQTSQAPSNLTGSAGTIYAFKGWKVDGALQSGNPVSITMDKPHDAVASYETRYQLIIDSQYGNPQGGGYYPAGSTATFSVTSPSGLLIQQVFTGWSGDYTGNSASGSITMDKPHTVQASWTTSYLQLGILVVALAVLGIAAFAVRRRRASRPPKTKLVPTATTEGGEHPPQEQMGETTAATATTAAAGTVACPSCGANVPGDKKFCENCGKPLSETS